MITNTISVPELLWTVFTIIGLFFNLRQLYRATGDFLYVKVRRINSIREYAATTTIMMFASWSTVQAIFVLLGIIAMTTKNANRTASPVQFALLAGFVSCSIFLAIAGFIVDVRRRSLVSKLKDIEDGI